MKSNSKIDHSGVHTWYHGTIDINSETDGKELIYNDIWYGDDDDIAPYGNPNLPPRGKTGYNQSRIGGEIKGQPSGDQNSPIFSFNYDGIYNGDFEKVPFHQDAGVPSISYAPGWREHGGGGSGEFYRNRLILRNDYNCARHNRFLIPEGFTDIWFYYWVDKATTSNNELVVYMGDCDNPDNIIGAVNLDYEHCGWQNCSIPEEKWGTIQTITFIIQYGQYISAIVAIDNVSFTKNEFEDYDCDTIDDRIEISKGSNPCSKDTDNDGLKDGTSEDLNANGIVDPGETDPLDPDTDNDGIYDGTEKGLTEPETDDTDLSSGFFIVDADPATTTDPTVADSDDDGIVDGNEDKNHDGWIDAMMGETDPSNPDSDGDGFFDKVEIDYSFNPNDPNDVNFDSDDDGYKDLEKYIGGTDLNDPNAHPTRPYIVENECHPFPGQGISFDCLRIPIDTSVIIRLKDDTGIDTNSIVMAVDGTFVVPTFKQVKGNNKDYWVIFRPTNDFDFSQIVNMVITAANIYGININAYEYSFKVESQTEHNTAKENSPASTKDESDPTQHTLAADPGTQIEGAKIIYASAEPEKPRFGPIDELPPLNIANAIGMPVALEPSTVFHTPVTIFIPCPGVEALSMLAIYYYNPAIGWRSAAQADGWMLVDSRINHPETTPPTIEIQINHFSAVQAGFEDKTFEDSNDDKKGGCLIGNVTL